MNDEFREYLSISPVQSYSSAVVCIDIQTRDSLTNAYDRPVSSGGLSKKGGRAVLSPSCLPFVGATV